MKLNRFILSWLFLICALWAPVSAENYVVLLNDLPFDEKGEKHTKTLGRNYSSWYNLSSRIEVRTGLKHPSYLAYCVPTDSENPVNTRYWSATGEKFQLAITCEKGATVKGWIDFPSDTYKDHRKTPLAFTLDTSKLKPATAEEFQKVRSAHYQQLAANHLPGTSWFAYQAHSESKPNTNELVTPEFSDTYRFAVGGQALAENLALDRELILGTNLKGDDVSINTLKGITVPPFDWKPLLKDLPAPQLDPLAHLIPDDQHALFCAGMKPLLDLISTFEQQGVPILQSASVQNPMKGLPAKYRRQMGLDLPDALALLLPVDSVAITGSDPFFPTGTDLALLFETTKPDALFQSLSATLQGKAKLANATAVKSQFKDLPYVAFESRDRSFSSHLARLGDTIVLTNSAAQLQRLLAVYQKEKPALVSMEEFRFFRSRYPQSGSESAFVFISDPTIRRWGSPQLRIAASRRTRAMAAISHLTSAAIDKQSIKTDYSPLLGKCDLSSAQVRSEKFNTLAFLTPTSEQNITTITAAEAQAYNTWKRGYEEGWSKVFDPIGIQLAIQPDSQGIDMTLLPLTIDSQYRRIIDWTGKAKLSQRARTPHAEALAFISIAIDKESEQFKQFEQGISSMFEGIKMNPFSWLGESITLYVDESDYWKQLASAEDGDQFMEDNLNKLPIGARIESENPLKLAVFLTSLRGLAESSAPGLLTWSKNEHKGQSYVTIKANKEEIGADISVHYAPMAKALLICLDEKMLHAAIEREQQPEEKVDATTADTQQLFFHANPQFLISSFYKLNNASFEDVRQSQSWNALPILNEWKRLHPDQDPVAFHQSHYATTIDCPGGNGYRWNDEAMTMESVAYGHPTGAKLEGKPLVWLNSFTRLRSALSFENDGLRVRAKLDTPKE